MLSADLDPKLEMRVPRTASSLVGAIAISMFLLFFIFLGLFNLFHGKAVIPSIIWLLLIGAAISGPCREKGIRRVASDIWGSFSLNRFIQTIRHENGHNEIQFGYRLFGFRFKYVSIRADKIARVNWRAGQASSITGQDKNDWSVVVWYDHGDPVKSQKRIKRNYPDQEMHIVGPMGRKQTTAEFGQAVVTFLRNSGASLVRDDNDCTFVRG